MYKFITDNTYHFEHKYFKENFRSDFIEIDPGICYIGNNYAWNGCSPKFELLDIGFGTPDGVLNMNTGKPKTYFASMIHDALYQYKEEISITRKQADEIFYDILRMEDFYWARTYYYAVRLFGWMCGKWKEK